MPRKERWLNREEAIIRDFEKLFTGNSRSVLWILDFLYSRLLMLSEGRHRDFTGSSVHGSAVSNNLG